MGWTPYYFMYSQGPDTHARVWVNDLPFVRTRGGDPFNRTGPAIHWLQPGDNSVRIEIDEAPAESQVFFELCVDWDHEHPAFYFEWPSIVRYLPIEDRVPLVWETRFCPLGEMFEPTHLGATPQSFGPEGTPAMRDLVRRVHESLERRDPDGYANLFELKLDETARAYPGWEGSDRSGNISDLVGLMGRPFDLRPLDFDEVRFESCCGGRVAYVCRPDGDFLIEAVFRDEAMARLRTDLYLCHLGGQWRVFR